MIMRAPVSIDASLNDSSTNGVPSCDALRHSTVQRRYAFQSSSGRVASAAPSATKKGGAFSVID